MLNCDSSLGLDRLQKQTINSDFLPGKRKSVFKKELCVLRSSYCEENKSLSLVKTCQLGNNICLQR